MTVQLLQTLSLVSFIAAGILLLVGIALFFLLDIPRLYGDVSGRTAKKAINAIRQQNEDSGNKAYKPSPVNAARGKLTDKITHSGRIKAQTEGLALHVGTEKISIEMAQTESIPSASKSKKSKNVSNETTLLETTANETAVLSSISNETTILSSSSNETTVLTANLPNSNNEQSSFEKNKPVVIPNGDFAVDVDMSFTGSSEIIE